MSLNSLQAVPGSAAKYLSTTWYDTIKISKVSKICNPRDSWSIYTVNRILINPRVLGYKAIYDRHMVGFVLGKIAKNRSHGWIIAICVHPDMQRKGIGQQLLTRCENKLEVPVIKLVARASNQIAIDIYTHNGYTQVDRLRNYYKGDEDGVVMEKKKN